MNDELEAMPFDRPPEPTQLEIEQAIAASTPEPQLPSNSELEDALRDAARARESLDKILSPIEEAQAGADEAKAAVEEARAEISNIEGLQAYEVDLELAREQQRKAAEAEAQRDAEAKRAQWQEYAAAEDTRFHSEYGDLDQSTRAGAVEMLRANLPEEVITQSWNGEGGIPLRSAFMQGLIVDAYKWRNQPKQVPRPVEQPRPVRQEVYQPRPVVDDGQSDLSPRAAARLLLANRR